MSKEITLLKGIFGAIYETKENRNHIKVTKKDGNSFFIPVEDIKTLGEIIKLKEEKSKIEEKLNKIYGN